ncbi:unnamed protein product [Arabis nemorensis]|uniref:Uncharacterized protein n=1 Tax=Arabis nemorensis TaxID=586526 RepID=A0A565BTX7_9BRAS|nr:unnamed protein product [Arabis nemorensis]
MEKLGREISITCDIIDNIKSIHDLYRDGYDENVSSFLKSIEARKTGDAWTYGRRLHNAESLLQMLLDLH